MMAKLSVFLALYPCPPPRRSPFHCWRLFSSVIFGAALWIMTDIKFTSTNKIKTVIGAILEDRLPPQVAGLNRGLQRAWKVGGRGGEILGTIALKLM